MGFPLFTSVPWGHPTESLDSPWNLQNFLRDASSLPFETPHTGVRSESERVQFFVMVKGGICFEVTFNLYLDDILYFTFLLTYYPFLAILELNQFIKKSTMCISFSIITFLYNVWTEGVLNFEDDELSTNALTFLVSDWSLFINVSGIYYLSSIRSMYFNSCGLLFFWLKFYPFFNLYV